MSTADIQSNMVVVESSRAVQRRQRQLAIEREQRLEEAEALKTLLTDVSFLISLSVWRGEITFRATVIGPT